MLKIVGQLTPEDAKIIDTATKLYLVGVRARNLGKEAHQEQNDE